MIHVVFLIKCKIQVQLYHYLCQYKFLQHNLLEKFFFFFFLFNCTFSKKMNWSIAMWYPGLDSGIQKGYQWKTVLKPNKVQNLVNSTITMLISKFCEIYHRNIRYEHQGRLKGVYGNSLLSVKLFYKSIIISKQQVYLKNQLAIFVWTGFWSLHSVPVTFVPLPSLIPHCLDYWGDFTVSEQFTNFILFGNLPHSLEAQRGQVHKQKSSSHLLLNPWDHVRNRASPE